MSVDLAQADKEVLELRLHSPRWPWSVEEVGPTLAAAGGRVAADGASSRSFSTRVESTNTTWSRHPGYGR
jgi:hypothetical protein